MWASIFGENNFFQNFNFTFPNNNNDILLHLTHWQYWFWFWFTYIFILYYFLFLKLVRSRSLGFKLKLNTSLKSHGKWGDILVCFLPISWCLNILTNSNFILRMIEWQTESTNFTLRVRGKQWYWVYKFEVKNYRNISNFKKKLGNNIWLNISYKPNFSYLLFLRNFNVTDQDFIIWNKSFFEWNELFFGDFAFFKKSNYSYINIKTKFMTSTSEINLTNHNVNFKNILNKSVSRIFLEKNDFNYNFFKNNFNIIDSFYTKDLSFKPSLYYPKLVNLPNLDNFFFNFKVSNNYIDKISRVLKNTNFYKPITLTLFKDNIGLNFNTTFLNKVKFQPISTFLVIKQKRFDLRNHFFKEIYFNRNNTLFSAKNSLFLNKFLNSNKAFDYKITSLNNRRLLRTKRILILPTHTNIAIITNSFDVIHSWYIPGLGLKLDCVPGRSTHHFLNISHVGFYYGQCAEICGRFHHHMPIRICALPFDHFILWWCNYGAPYFFVDLEDRGKYRRVTLRTNNW